MKTQPDIEAAAAEAVEIADRLGLLLDFSVASLVVIEKMLADASVSSLSSERAEAMAMRCSGYILEVARRRFGGAYKYYDARSAPVLVVSGPDWTVALLARDKVRGRLSGDEGDNIPFFFEGFVEAVSNAKPGQSKLYV